MSRGSPTGKVNGILYRNIRESVMGCLPARAACVAGPSGTPATRNLLVLGLVAVLVMIGICLSRNNLCAEPFAGGSIKEGKDEAGSRLLSEAQGTAFSVSAENRTVYKIPPRSYHRKGENLVKATGKDCRECHDPRFYPQKDFFGWEFRQKWVLQWGLFSVAAFVMLIGCFNALQFWQRGKRSSLHNPLHWPTAIRALLQEALLGRRVFRQSRYRWTVFVTISIAFLALAVVFGLIVLTRFVLPAGHLFSVEVGLVLDFLADFLGGVILVGTLLALLRRTVLKKEHMKSDPEDFIILLLLLAIVLTGFFLEACRLAVVSPEPGIWASFLGALIASGLRAWDLPWTVIRFYVWILHAALVFGLLAYLPFSKLFHLITSPVSIAATASEAHYRQRE